MRGGKRYERGRKPEVTLGLTKAQKRERQRRLQAEWRRKNPEAIKALYEEHYRRNRSVYYARSSHATSLRRVAAARTRDPSLPDQPDLSEDQKAACLAVRLEAYCRTELTGVKHVVDHIVDIVDGGLEVPENLQVLTLEQHRLKTYVRRVSNHSEFLASLTPD